MGFSSVSPSSTRDDNASVFSTSFSQPHSASPSEAQPAPSQAHSLGTVGRRRVEREQFSLALDPSPSTPTSVASSTSAGAFQSSSSSSSKSRRPSSVFEHVGGMLDRFGRRLHSRSEARDSTSSGKRPSSSVLFLAGIGAGASDSSEAVSLEGELSPSASNSVHQTPFSERYKRSGSASSTSIEASNPASPLLTRKDTDQSTTASRLSAVGSPPIMHRNHSAGSSSFSNHDANLANRSSPSSSQFGAAAPANSSSTQSRRLSVIDRVLIQVTEDNERFSVVDISGLNSADAVKERMLSKLHLFDEDPSSFALSRTEIGAVGSTGPRLDDDELLAMCWQMGDDKGSLKFLLHQIAPPSIAGRPMMPPPQQQQFSPRIVMNDLAEGSSTANTATTPTSNSRQEYSKSASLSSRSSIGEQSHQSDSGAAAATAAANDQSSDSALAASVRPQSGLIRSRANNQRRSLAGSTSTTEDVQSLKMSENDTVGRGARQANSSLPDDGSSPIEEISDALDVEIGRLDASRRQQLRSSAMQVRHSIHGQWDCDAGTSSSSSSSRTLMGQVEPSSPKLASSTISTLSNQNRPSALRTASHPAPTANDAQSSQQSASYAYSEVSSPSSTQSNVPRSLLAGGGREQRPLTHPHDSASRMYTGVSNSSDYTGLSSSSDFDYDYGEDARMRPSRPSASSSTVSDNFRSFPEPTHRSQSANPFGPRPSTSDARSDFRSPFGSGMNAGQQQQHAQAHMSQPPSSSAMTSPISPLARPFDRERSSSFGAGPPFHGYNPSLMHQVSMQELRGYAHPTSKLSDPPLRPIVTSQQHIPHMQSPHQAGYANSPPPRPMPNPNMFADRRYMSGPAPLPNAGRPTMYEFGARSSVYDSRTAYSAPRPSPMMSDRARFNNSGPGGMPHQGHPNHQTHHQGHPHALRDDPAFMTMHFPASNSRMVSEFQRTATSSQSSLQPGMTVQESMQQNVWSPVHQQSQRPGAPPSMQFRPNNQPQQGPHRVLRTESFTGSSPMMHTASMSSSYGRESRPQQKSSVGPPRAHDLRSETPGANSQLPASMRYYYNPATPNPASRAAVPAALTPSSPRASNGHASSSSSAAASPAQTPFAQLNNKASERYSGSSFNTTESSMHTRVPSSNDGRRLDGEHSAPSSARSSRTSRSMSPTKENEKALTELPYANKAHGSMEGDTEELMSEEDLMNIRPLPRLPAVENISLDGRSSSAKEESKDEDTYRAGQWNQVIAKIGAEREGGTITAVRTSSGSPLQPSSTSAKASPTTLASSNAILGTDALGQGPTSAEDVTEEGEGAFKTFDDDDDDEDDQGGTWAQPLDTAVKTTPTPLAKPLEGSKKESGRVQSPDHDEGTLKPDSIQSPVSQRAHSPRRPVLTLNIETPKTASPQRIDDAELPETSLSALSNTQPTPSPASSNLIGRRTSFAGRERGEWAFRPPPEQLYENLDDFFSKHDLDKPVIDPATGLAPTSPQSGSPRAAEVPKMTSVVAPSATPSVAAPAPAPAPTTSTPPVTVAGLAGLGKSRMQHQKSIRIVAQDRKRLLEKTEAADRRKPTSLALATNDLSRRRSTKLWGGRVIEVTPADTSGAVTHSDSPTSTTSSTEGKPVFKWVKGDLIGKGTYGRVYLALNATTGEMIAVKQVELPTTDSDREDARQKSVVTALKSEIETLKDLDHPNIVSYLGFEETRANLSIFLEYVPGGSVGSCLRKHGKLDEATIKSFLQQILNGLNYLHGRGILHRDLKADNLLVDYDGIVKISDFGTVRKSEDIYGNVASMSMQGSIFWMAPEVVSLSRAGYSAKVDIWSLGCVVLEMFAGRRPWSDEEAVQAMFKIGAERRAPPIPPDVRLSKAAAHFLKTCFAVDPNQRPTASRLLEHVFPHAEVGWAFNMSSLYRQLHR